MLQYLRTEAVGPTLIEAQTDRCMHMNHWRTNQKSVLGIRANHFVAFPALTSISGRCMCCRAYV